MLYWCLLQRLEAHTDVDAIVQDRRFVILKDHSFQAAIHKSLLALIIMWHLLSLYFDIWNLPLPCVDLLLRPSFWLGIASQQYLCYAMRPKSALESHRMKATMEKEVVKILRRNERHKQQASTQLYRTVLTIYGTWNIALECCPASDTYSIVDASIIAQGIEGSKHHDNSSHSFRNRDHIVPPCPLYPVLQSVGCFM
jgi:hypothetical protein